MGKSNRFKDNNNHNDTPGPGSYKVTKKFDGRHSSFGKINKKPEIYKYPEPGPASY